MNFLHLLNEKNGLDSVQHDEVPEIRFLLIIGWVCRSKQFWTKLYCQQCEHFQFIDNMLFGQVRWAVFAGAIEIIIFGAKMAQPP